MSGAVSSYFLRRLPGMAAGEVHSVFRTSFNVMARGFLAHIGTTREPLSCLGISISPQRMQRLLPCVRPGDRAVFRGGSLRIYNREGVSVIPMGELEPVPLEIPRCPPPGAALGRALEGMELERQAGIPVDGALAAALEALCAPRPDDPRLEDAVRFLLGRGKGLTPSGDDILMGYGAGLWAWGDPGPFCRALETVLRQRRTTAVSAAYLEAVLDGCANQDFCRLFRAVQAGDGDACGVLLEGIRRHGHTSGCDSLLGLRTAARLLARLAESPASYS